MPPGWPARTHHPRQRRAGRRLAVHLAGRLGVREPVEKVYPNLTYFNEVDKGGHFAAWEEPELFATEIRAAFSPLR